MTEQPSGDMLNGEDLRMLDVMVATEVFGKHVILNSGGAWLAYPNPAEAVPRYSTDGNAMLLVLERLKDFRGGHCSFSIEWGSDDWHITVWHSHNADEVEVYHPCLGIAVCHAAIAVVRAARALAPVAPREQGESSPVQTEEEKE